MRRPQARAHRPRGKGRAIDAAALKQKRHGMPWRFCLLRKQQASNNNLCLSLQR
jgi:hypothetical protein